jgi:hypothetical protein
VEQVQAQEWETIRQTLDIQPVANADATEAAIGSN